MSAPKGNEYAAKPDEDIVRYKFHVRGTYREIQAWKKAAAGLSSNQWARKTLNAAALPSIDPRAAALPSIDPRTIMRNDP